MQLREKADTPGKFEVVDESGTVVATGTLDCEYVQGARRHGSISFIQDDEPTPSPRSAAVEQAVRT